MAKNLEITVLYDFYGDLLTEKQQEVIELYYNEDLSLAEIAALSGITRQGVRDSIKRPRGSSPSLRNGWASPSASPRSRESSTRFRRISLRSSRSISAFAEAGRSLSAPRRLPG